MTAAPTPRRVYTIVLLFCGISLLAGFMVTAQEGARPRLIIQSGHIDAINDVAYSPDGSVFATAGNDRTVKLWDARTRRLLNNLEGHSGAVQSVAFSPDGGLLASGGENKELKLWEVKSGRLFHDLSGHQSTVNSVAFSPDGRLLASAAGRYEDVSDNTIRLWDVRSGAEIGKFSGHADRVSAVAFAVDGSMLISASRDKTTRVWSVSNHRQLRTMRDEGYGDQLTVLPGGQYFATLGDKKITIRDIEGVSSRDLVLPSPAAAIAFGRDSSTVAVGYYNNTAELRDLGSGQVLLEFEGDVNKEDEGFIGGINALAFSPTSDTIVAVGGDRRIRLWGRRDGKLLGTIARNDDAPISIAMRADGKVFASGGMSGEIILWDSTSGRPIRRLSGHTDAVSDVAFSPDGRLIASVSFADKIKIWSASSGNLIREIGEEGLFLKCVTFSPDGRLIAVGGEEILVDLYETATGNHVRTLEVPNSGASASARIVNASYASRGGAPFINSIAFSPDGKLLAAGDDYTPLNLWDVRSGRWISTMKESSRAVLSVAFSPDGQTIFTGNDDHSVKSWSVSNRRRLWSIPEASSVATVAVGLGGNVLASAGEDGILKLRNTSDGSLSRVLAGHTSRIGAVAFNHSGNMLVSCSLDGTIKTWSLPEGKLMASIISFKDHNWLTYTPDGFYDGSAGTDRYVTWSFGNALHEAARYKQQFNNPPIVAARLARPATSQPFVPIQPHPTPTSEVVATPAGSEEGLWLRMPSKQFHALIIGNNNYKAIRSLTTAIADAEEVEKVLRESYGFKTKLLKDARREQIMLEINRYRRELDENSSLLIYYAGHGQKDEKVQKAYWLPVDATEEDTTNWVSADDITSSLKGMAARHVVVISDSCYSGAIPRSGEIVGTGRYSEREKYLLKMMSGTSRTFIASGGDEPVEDRSRNGHSVFANALLRGLREFEWDVFTAQELFQEFIRIPVAGNSNQTPEFDALRNSGHIDGHFIFVRRRLQR